MLKTFAVALFAIVMRPAARASRRLRDASAVREPVPPE